MWLTAPEQYWFVVLTSVVPFALAGYLLALVCLLALVRRAPAGARRWYGGAAVLALGGVLLHLVLLAPAYLGEHATGRADLVVMNLNLHHGDAEADRVVALVRSRGVGVLVLEEVTAEARQRLRTAGLDDVLTHAAGEPAAGSTGTMIFSAAPLGERREIDSGAGAHAARVEAAEPFWVVGVHTAQPLNDPAAWRHDWAAVTAAVGSLDGDVLVVGDFNATLDHRPVRRLLDLGLTDAARRANSGWQPTWPSVAGRFGLLTIDHVLFSDRFDAVRTTAVYVDGSDHRALVADLRRSTLDPT